MTQGNGVVYQERLIDEDTIYEERQIQNHFEQFLFAEKKNLMNYWVMDGNDPSDTHGFTEFAKEIYYDFI